MSGVKSSKTYLLFQDACYKHRYIRSNDLSNIVERPERLRAVKVGLAAAIARIEELSQQDKKPKQGTDETGGELVDALQKLDLLQDTDISVVDIIPSSRRVDLLNNQAVKYVHGDIDGDVYLENLVKWAKESSEKVKGGESEIPSELSQGDLYLCPESLEAIQGALGTVCEAVDKVMSISRSSLEQGTTVEETANAFVAIRPPGHHCGEDTPSGFCFVNNVVVAAAHAHLKHKIKKVVIFDIDLHHGNGTQSLVWQINEEWYRRKLEIDHGAPNTELGVQIFYGSLHDILSYPCEDGKVPLVQAASVSIHAAHGQHIENIHLQEYRDEKDFYENLYKPRYCKLFSKAEQFLKDTRNKDVLVFISCGFDACEHEYPSMSRHNRRVPTSFYYQFAKDCRAFASKFSGGKFVSVLEGGYSDRALISGAMTHLIGLVDDKKFRSDIDKGWWGIKNLSLLEKIIKKRRGRKTSTSGIEEKWLERASDVFQTLETVIITPPTKSQVPPPSTRTLRERRPVSPRTTPIPISSPPRKGKQTTVKASKPDPKSRTTSTGEESLNDVVKNLQELSLNLQGSDQETDLQAKKLPRIILRVKEPEDS